MRRSSRMLRVRMLLAGVPDSSGTSLGTQLIYAIHAPWKCRVCETLARSEVFSATA